MIVTCPGIGGQMLVVCTLASFMHLQLQVPALSESQSLGLRPLTQSQTTSRAIAFGAQEFILVPVHF